MTEKNNNLLKELFSLVALIFPFFVFYLLDDPENDYNLSENDITFIKNYKKAWYFVVSWVLFTIIFFVISFYTNISILVSISTISVVILALYIFVNIFFIFAGKNAILFKKTDFKNLDINKVNSWNIFYILAYLPFINFYLYNWKKYTQEEEYRLKEASLFYLIWSVIGIISIFFSWFLVLFYFILFFIIIRSISLFFGIDFFPDDAKKFVYSSYEDNPLEIFAYFCAFIYYILNSLYLFFRWKKLADYWKYLYKTKKSFKNTYEFNYILKKPKKYLYLILSYMVFILIFAYLLYKSWYSFYTFVYLFSLFIFASYIIIIYYNHKKLVFLPILTSSISLIVSKFR